MDGAEAGPGHAVAAPADLLYRPGKMPKVLRNALEKALMLEYPTLYAAWLTGVPSSSRANASSSRRCCRQTPKLTPVCRRNTRVNVLRLMQAIAASSSRSTSRIRLSATYWQAAASLSLSGNVTGRRERGDLRTSSSSRRMTRWLRSVPWRSAFASSGTSARSNSVTCTRRQSGPLSARSATSSSSVYNVRSLLQRSRQVMPGATHSALQEETG